MDKFAHEKARRADIVKKRGADPIWSGIRKGDEYLNTLASHFPKVIHKARSAKTPEKIERVNLPDLSPESLKMFGLLIVFHPKTLVREIKNKPDGEFEVIFASWDEKFVDSLLSSLAALDRFKNEKKEG